MLFSLQILFAIERLESELQTTFSRIKSTHNDSRSREDITIEEVVRDYFINALTHTDARKSELIKETFVTNLIADVLPQRDRETGTQFQPASPIPAMRSSRGGDGDVDVGAPEIVFSQWEWVLAVVAYEYECSNTDLAIETMQSIAEKIKYLSAK